MEQLPNKLMKLNDNYYRIGCNCMDKNCDLDIFIDKMEDTSLWEMSISGTFWCNENYKRINCFDVCTYIFPS